MNFTREPIIETVITPQEGCKLVVRSSKGNGQEDYFVDAVEVVSFGHSLFFRSLERPKPFLVPVSDYEILELKETRMTLKSASAERSIKIGGGRESQPRSTKEDTPESSPQPERKRDKRRRGRRGRDRQEQQPSPPPPQDFQEPEPLPAEVSSEEPPLESEKTPSFISKLFPPPPTLIKESLSRYKPAEPSPEDLFPSLEEQEEKPPFEFDPPSEEPTPEGEPFPETPPQEEEPEQ